MVSSISQGLVQSPLQSQTHMMFPVQPRQPEDMEDKQLFHSTKF
jgi:hypothetical protein